MTPEEARRIIVAAVDKVTHAFNAPGLLARRDDPSADIAFSELEMDSLSAMEICMAIEEASGIEIDLADLAAERSVNGLARLLLSRAGP